MKKVLLIAIVLIVGSLNVGFAQEKAVPRTEYSVSLSESVVTLKAGETKQVTVSVVRSKAYSRSGAKLGLSTSLPAGITVAYEPAEGMFESSVASFTASADTKPGEYQVVLKTTVNNKIKGSVVKIVVESGTSKDAVTVN